MEVSHLKINIENSATKEIHSFRTSFRHVLIRSYHPPMKYNIEPLAKLVTKESVKILRMGYFVTLLRKINLQWRKEFTLDKRKSKSSLGKKNGQRKPGNKKNLTLISLT